MNGKNQCACLFSDFFVAFCFVSFFSIIFCLVFFFLWSWCKLAHFGPTPLEGLVVCTNPMASSFVTQAVRSANGELIDDFQKVAKKAASVGWVSDCSSKTRVEKGIDRIELEICRESAQRTCLPTIGWLVGVVFVLLYRRMAKDGSSKSQEVTDENNISTFWCKAWHMTWQESTVFFLWFCFEYACSVNRTRVMSYHAQCH